MKQVFKMTLVLILLYLIFTLIVNHGKLYQRNSYTPVSINDSRINGTFIDSFINNNLEGFEIWRSYLKYVDYYGLGGPIATRYIPKDSSFYIALRYNHHEDRNLFFRLYDIEGKRTNNFGHIANGELVSLKHRQHDTIPVYIFEQPGDTTTFHLLDSIRVYW